MNNYFIAKISYDSVSQKQCMSGLRTILSGKYAHFSYDIWINEAPVEHKISYFENERIVVFCMGVNLPDHFFETLYSYYERQALPECRTLPGIFSFILIDKHRLHCSILVDYTGIFPLYYVTQSKTLWLSNKQRALFPCLQQQAQLNPSVFFEVLYNGFSMPGSTLVQHINSIAPHVLTLFNGVLHHKNLTHFFDNTVVYSEKQFMELICCAFERLCAAQQEVHILSSGGLDSAFMVAVCAKILKKKVVQHTVALHKHSIEYSYSQQLHMLYATDVHYYTPSLPAIIEYIDSSILAGESHIIGQLAVNAAFEWQLMHEVAKRTSQIISGETILILPSAYQNINLGAFAGRWRILNKAEILALLPNQARAYLHYIQKNQEFLNEHVSVDEAFKCYYSVFASYSGKIFASYRNRLQHALAVMQPFSDVDLVYYVNSLVAQGGFNYRDTVRQICIQNNLLPAQFFQQPKKWMPSIWRGQEGSVILNKMTQEILDSNEQAQYPLQPDSLKQLVQMKKGIEKEQLILTLFYFFRFCSLFSIKI